MSSSSLPRLLLALALGVLPARALAADPGAVPSLPPPPQAAPPEPPVDLPPPPVDSAPPQQVAPPPAAAAASGQWVHTTQYGWVWMPYERAYTYVPDAGTPSMFVYAPVVGWHWVAAPWVFGWGPAPYWGVYGPARFVWYSRPWFVVHPAPYYHGHYDYGHYGHYGHYHGHAVHEVHVHGHHGHR